MLWLSCCHLRYDDAVRSAVKCCLNRPAPRGVAAVDAVRPLRTPPGSQPTRRHVLTNHSRLQQPCSLRRSSTLELLPPSLATDETVILLTRSPSLFTHLLKMEEVQQNDSLADGYPPRLDADDDRNAVEVGGHDVGGQRLIRTSGRTAVIWFHHGCHQGCRSAGCCNEYRTIGAAAREQGYIGASSGRLASGLCSAPRRTLESAPCQPVGVAGKLSIVSPRPKYSSVLPGVPMVAPPNDPPPMYTQM